MHFRINFRSFHVRRRRRLGHHFSFGCCFHLHVVTLMIIIHPRFRLINLEYVHRPNTSQHRWLLYVVCSLSLKLPMDDVVDEALGQLGRNYTIWCTICFDSVARPNYQQISLCFLSNSFTISSIRGGIKSTNQMVNWTKWNADSNWLTRLRVAALFISFQEKKRNFFWENPSWHDSFNLVNDTMQSDANDNDIITTTYFSTLIRCIGVKRKRQSETEWETQFGAMHSNLRFIQFRTNCCCCYCDECRWFFVSFRFVLFRMFTLAYFWSK